jgi:uncharacterized tellurite resistance protein B-like protein
MRSYPRNSPEAAARLVALVLISDGHVCRSEVEALRRLEAERELGLAPGAMSEVMHTLCEDLLAGAYAGGTMMCSIDEGVLTSLLAEVDEPALQRKVLRLARAAADADEHLADAEELVVKAARQQWGIDDEGATAFAPAVESARLSTAM